jgi:hypothetical protein
MNFVFSKKTCHRTAALMVAISFMSLVAPVLAQNSVDKLSSDELVKAKAALEVIHDKLSKIGKTQSQIQLVDSDEIDIQTADDDKGTISLSTALVLHFRDDRDAVASLIARQQASQRKKPVAKQETKKSPTVSKLMDMVGSAVSSAVDAKVGISGAAQTAAEGGSEVIDRVASQVLEKEIDEASVNWLAEAGYNPYGAIRAQKSLSALPEGSRGQKLATNPEKVAYLEALVEDNPKAKAFSADAKTPLLSRPPASSSASANGTASNSMTVKTSGDAGDEPIEGVSLSRYAAIKNDIAFKGESEGLAKHNLTAEAFAKIDQQWSSRIAQDKNRSLNARYATHYLEASQGEFADWGRDVAQVKQTGRLQLGTDPTGVDDWVALHKAHQEAARGGPDAVAAFGKAAKDKGLSLYDFQIVNAWWAQRAKDRASQGDRSLLQRMN